MSRQWPPKRPPPESVTWKAAARFHHNRGAVVGRTSRSARVLQDPLQADVDVGRRTGVPPHVTHAIRAALRHLRISEPPPRFRRSRAPPDRADIRCVWPLPWIVPTATNIDRKSTRLNSSHLGISYAVFC